MSFTTSFDNQRREASILNRNKGSRIIGRTSSGGMVRTRSQSEIRAAEAKASAAARSNSNRRGANSSNRRKPTEIIDLRNCANKSNKNIGDVRVAVQENFSADMDDDRTTAVNALKRLREAVAKGSSKSSVDAPLSFDNTSGLINDLQGARRLSDPTLRGTGFGAGGAGGSGSGSGMGSMSAILGLPTPDNLQENLRIGYDSKNQGVVAHLQNAIMQGLNSGIKALASGDDTAFKEIESEVMARFDKEVNRFTGPGSGTQMMNLVGALANMSGFGTGFNVAFNNTMVQQFTGVSPRSFTFQWRLYADDESQSRQIFRTIHLLKLISHPVIVNDFLNIVRFPMVIKEFDIRSPNGLRIFPIFPSVITDVVADYTGSGVPTFFKSGAPTSVNLSVSLTEITSLTRQDYASKPSGFI